MDRSRLYKNKDKSSEELRRRRVDQSIELRRAKKDEQLQKRRNILLVELDETSPLKEKQIETPDRLDFDSVVRLMKSSDGDVKLSAVQQCRKLLSRARDPPIDEFIKRNAVELLVESLSSKSDSLVFEACWALTNIASGTSDQTAAVVESGAIPKLIALLSHPEINVAEQSVWALGNVVGEGPVYRDMVLGAGILHPIVKLLERTWHMDTVVSNITWVLSNLCRNRDPPPPLDLIRAMLPIFNRLLQYENENVLVDAAWAISYASDTANNTVDDILSSGCLSHLIRLLSRSSPNILSPSVRAIGNLVVGDNIQTQVVLDAGFLRCVPSLLSLDKPNIVKEVCWAVSNITAGSPGQIQAVIDHKIVPLILDLLHKAEFRIQKEACWVISNMINGGTDQQCVYLVNSQVIPALCKLLSCVDSKILVLVLESIRKLLEVAEEFGNPEPACIELETCGALDLLEKLQDHKNEQVYKLAFDIIGRFFSDGNTESDTPTEPLTLEQNEDRNSNGGAEQLKFVAPDEQSNGAENFDF